MRDEKNRESGSSEVRVGHGHSRRSFLKGVGAAAGASMFLTDLVMGQEGKIAKKTPDEIPGVRVLGRGKRSVQLTINGVSKTVEVEPRTTLLEAIREQVGLTGCKEVCSRGSCGACTVLLDGVAVCSCLFLAVDAEGKHITTAEGIAADPKYKKLVDGFCENDSCQCGYCIPGFVVRTAAFLKENPSPTPEAIREGLSGNLCRCGTYTKIFDGVAAASKGGAR